MIQTSENVDILAIAPHPDDAEMCVGGFLAKMAEAGYRVGVLDLTQGEMGSLGTVETRKAEAERASSILGLTVRANAMLPDGYLGMHTDSKMSLEQQLLTAVSHLRAFKPKLLLLPYWEERHPDHVGAAQLFDKAVFLAGLRNFEPSSGAPFTPMQTIYYQMRYEFRPTFIVDVTAQYPKKVASIHCFASQVAPSQAPASNVLVGTKLHLSALEARDRHTGSMIGADYGEAFLTRNVISLGDPFAFFSNEALGAPLYFPTQR